MPPTDRILANGIRFLAEPIAATKAAAIGFWFSRGSRDEGPDTRGITHFIEHMLFKGTSTRSAREIALFFDRIGGYVNAFTEREHLCVYCVVPADHASAAAEILLSMLRDSLFSPVDAEKERSVIVSEILASLDDSEEMAMDAALAAMYPDHGISLPIAGSVEGIEGLESSLVGDHYRRFFRDTPPVAAVAGNIDIDLFSQLLETAVYPEKPAGRLDSGMDGSPVPLWRAGRYYPESPFGQSQIFLSRPLELDRTAANWLSWAAINAIIGDSVSSRLFQTLREDKGLCYSVYSTFAVNRDTALWSAYAATPPERTAETVGALIEEMAAVHKNGFTDTEMADARTHLAGELLLSSEDTENRMKRLARQYFYNGTLYTVDDTIELLASLRNDDVQALARRAFSGATESLVVYAGKKQTRECRKIWQ